MEPVIVIELTLENGRKFCFECKLIKFNQLRFAVASMLKVINNLEEKTILKPLDM
ncbi:hypothetical protein B4U80_03017 [Leptotrombidium deliense]|uniref:Uncharacterized protein n=1 Tax=Leptotrombidium deliense TaxID=299467 RepID=A0A443S7A8_9ACAR|nr:hypothetical protein B4U80_03017 [Leptotrombidium deliense]